MGGLPVFLTRYKPLKLSECFDWLKLCLLFPWFCGNMESSAQIMLFLWLLFHFLAGFSLLHANVLLPMEVSPHTVLHGIMALNSWIFQQLPDTCKQILVWFSAFLAVILRSIGLNGNRRPGAANYKH